MGLLAQKIKSKKEKELVVEKSSKEKKDKKFEVNFDGELLELLKKTDDAEKEYASLLQKYNETIEPIKKALGLDVSQEKLEKIQEQKDLLVKKVIEYIKNGGKSCFSVEVKLGRKTPKYKDMCEEFIPEKLKELKDDPKWFNQTRTEILVDEEKNPV